MKTIKVPIYLKFDKEKIIGWVEIEDQYRDQFPELALAPEFIVGYKEGLLGFGLVEFDSYKKSAERYFKEKRKEN